MISDQISDKYLADSFTVALKHCWILAYFKESSYNGTPKATKQLIIMTLTCQHPFKSKLFALSLGYANQAKHFYFFTNLKWTKMNWFELYDANLLNRWTQIILKMWKTFLLNNFCIKFTTINFFFFWWNALLVSKSTSNKKFLCRLGMKRNETFKFNACKMILSRLARIEWTNYWLFFIRFTVIVSLLLFKFHLTFKSIFTQKFIW